MYPWADEELAYLTEQRCSTPAGRSRVQSLHVDREIAGDKVPRPLHQVIAGAHQGLIPKYVIVAGSLQLEIQ